LSEGRIGLFYRQLSLPITWLLVRTPVTANQVSVIWLVLGLVGVGLLASGIYIGSIFGALLLQVAAILDRVDGEVARYKRSQSTLGVFLDLAAHIFIKSFLFIAISFGVYRNEPKLSVILLGISGASFLTIGQNLRFYKSYIFQKNNLLSGKRQPSRSIFFKLLTKLENLWWTLGLFGVVLLGALTNTLPYVLLFYGVVTPLWAFSVLIRLVREMRNQDQNRILKIAESEPASIGSAE
jgi:phosphatidylglycerophosphate synthase